MERAREEEYRQKIDSILIPVLGVDNYTAQVDLLMDFTLLNKLKNALTRIYQLCAAK